jgi:hypothetical protein
MKGKDDKGAGLKSAYELALERLERDGIERPREAALEASIRERLAETRRRAEAKLAELEILHHDELRRLYEPEARGQAENDYVRERRRIEEERDRQLEKIRSEPG